MQTMRRDPLRQAQGEVKIRTVAPDAPQRQATEDFIKDVFASHYDANVTSFAPNLVRFELGGDIIAAAGWRGAAAETLFLEHYLDKPVDAAISQLTGRTIPRERIVEVGNLAAVRQGSSLHVIANMTREFDRIGYEWVVFTATRQLIAIFSRLGLPLLALSKADPARLGDAALQWGRYYDEQPVVVAGLIQIAAHRLQGQVQP